jgi:hypothetical protein
MGLLDNFSFANLEKNLLGSTPEEQSKSLLSISSALRSPTQRGESAFGNVSQAILGGATERGVANKDALLQVKKDARQRANDFAGLVPSGSSFNELGEADQLKVQSYIEKGEGSYGDLLQLDFGVNSAKAPTTVSGFDSETGAKTTFQWNATDKKWTAIGGGEVSATTAATLSNHGKVARDLNLTPGTPEFAEKVQELLTESNKGSGPLVTIDNSTNNANKELAEKNVARLAELQVGSGSRELSLTKAEGFLKAFKEGKANSGAGRKMLSFSPFGTYTSQGEFDEQLDSFSEIAARSKLKAVGEIRPTDADVKGMKESLFGIGKDEEVNIQLLQDFIQEQTSLQDEYKGLTSANEAGTIAGFQSIAGTMSPREADPVKITGWFRGISPDSALFDDIVGKMTGAQREILFQEIQAGRF